MDTTTTPDEAERARAAVAVACLAWLRCTGPASGLPAEGPGRDPGSTPRPSPLPPLSLSPDHPLWDRWLDG